MALGDSRPKPKIKIPDDQYTLPEPIVFGTLFPAKFTAWRKDQPRAVITSTNSDYRFVGQAAPTGFGKSLAYAGAALLEGKRTIVLTSTKGLQEQLLTDFNGDGINRLVDIRGQGNYRCIAATEFGYPEYTTCDYAPCHAGRLCRLKESGCKYYDAYRLAQEAQIVVANYAYWMSINKYGQGLGAFDFLILDEAHDAPDVLAAFMGIEIEPKELVAVGGKMMDTGANIKQWVEWANYLLGRCKARVDQLQATIRQTEGAVSQNAVKDAASIKKLVGKLESLSQAEDDWVIEKVERKNHPSDYSVKFDPIWPYKFAEKYLFMSIPKVALFSATLRPKTAKLLGIDLSDFDFQEYDSTFPVARRPIIHVPTVQMNFRTPPENIGLWLRRIDQIISRRLDRKGIIHTVSFARAKQIQEYSDYRGMMLLNDSKNTKWTVERYKSSSGPTILVTPSVTTGYDFPYDECEYQIIGKLPFPDNRAKVIKARMNHDKEFSDYFTMQVLIQMAGRGMRAVDDRCETLICDDSIIWFMKNNARFAPQWFRDAFRWNELCPTPLEKL